MKNGKLQAAVIGCGSISKVHIIAIQTLADVEIAAVCDIKPDRAQAAAEATGAKAYGDWHEVVALPEIDVVHICLPHYLHAPVAIEALGNGKNVLTEKPMATTVADARKMIEASEKEGAGTLGVIFQNRYNAAVQKALEIVKSGEMGEFKGARAEVSWTRSRSYYVDSGWRGSKLTEGAGSLINQAIHTLDLLSYIGGPIEKVRGAVFTGLLENDIEVEDNAMGVAIYEGGQRAVIHTTNNYVADAPVEVELQMEKGVLKLYGNNLFKVEKDSFELIARGENKSVVGKAYWGSSHGTQIEDYYSCIRRGEKFWIDGRSGLPALALVCAIVQSSEEKRWVTLEKA
ncbi:MAG: Gfo/Idh/MocA family oxidoreductase [Clostridia bacterium]|nr:Gfo/Idh/MocA family oxidoreductase [Clostridia bacterium]